MSDKREKQALDQPDLPKILVVSDAPISWAHGTGAVVMRHFSGYPDELISEAHCSEYGVPAWPNSQRFQARPQVGAVNTPLNGIARIYNAIAWRAGLRSWLYRRPFTFTPRALDTLGSPDLIYSVVFSRTGLALVDHILSAIRRPIPLVQYFLDYEMEEGFGSARHLRHVIACADEIWALTDNIADTIGKIAAAVGKAVRVEPGFHLEVPREWKRLHRTSAEPDFTCVICGNFWSPQMVPIVRRVWRRVQQIVPGLGPIQWFCHPVAVSKIRQMVGDVQPELQPAGFVTGADFFHLLIRADLAIVPFSVLRTPKNPYERYSLPSRLTELLSVGLPVFCIAGERTPLADYITKNCLGQVYNAEDEERLAQKLAAFILDREGRSAAGARGRQFAEREFALGPFQRFLYQKLAQLAAGGATKRDPIAQSTDAA